MAKDRVEQSLSGAQRIEQDVLIKTKAKSLSPALLSTEMDLETRKEVGTNRIHGAGGTATGDGDKQSGDGTIKVQLPSQSVCGAQD